MHETKSAEAQLLERNAIRHARAFSLTMRKRESERDREEGKKKKDGGNVSRYYRNIDPFLTTHRVLSATAKVEKCQLHLKFPHLGQ